MPLLAGRAGCHQPCGARGNRRSPGVRARSCKALGSESCKHGIFYCEWLDQHLVVCHNRYRHPSWPRLAMPSHIGELLIKENFITTEQLEVALKHQRDNGGRLGSILITLGFVDDDDITSVLSRQYGVPSINLAYFEIDPSVIKLIPAEVAQKYLIVPLSRVGSTLTIATADPTNVFAMDDIKFMTGFNVEPVVSSEASIQEALEKYYGSVHAIELKKVYEEIAQSDKEAFELDLEASLDEDQEVSVDELQRSSEEAPIIKLVFEEASLKRIEEAILKPYGMVLVTGPTGSGKTSTLYFFFNDPATTET